MSREIKFRAWDTKYNEWVYLVIEPTEENRDYTISFNSEAYRIIARHLTNWEQFTGLKDKNGKEIYEGDILANREVHGDNFYCVVEYGIDGFNGVTYPGRNHCMPLHTIMTYEGAEYNEVIGNIYENPELLSKLNKE